MAVLNFPSDPSTQTPVNTYSPDSTPLASDQWGYVCMGW